MKLKGKILTIVLTPIILLCAIIYVVCSREISTAMKDLIHNDLEAMAVVAKEVISQGAGGTNYYTLDENGTLWNGNMNLTSEAAMAGLDDVKEIADIDVTIFYGDTRRATTVKDDSGKRVLGTQAGQAVIDTVLVGGQTYFAENVDVVGKPYFAFYMPLCDSTNPTKPIGMIFAGMPQEDVEAKISAILIIILIVGVVLAVVCALIAFIIVNRIIKRIRSSMAVVKEVSEGNLLVDIKEADIKVKDEVGDISRATAELKDRLYEIAKNINAMCEQVRASAVSLDENAELSATHISQIDTAVNEIAQGASTQAEETQHTTENVIVMGDMIEKDNTEIGNLNTNAAEMNRTSEVAISTLKELEEINNKTKKAIDVIYEQTHTTNESAAKIREAVNLITDIAEETNLLSLNASIEAARAGEQGRGFAVVAGQIQKLAEQSNDSARKIEEIVISLIEDSDKSVEMMNGIRSIMVEQNEKVDRTGDMFGELKHGIDQSVTAVNVIAESTKEIDRMRVGVVDASQNLTSIAEENAASAEETSAAVSELTGIVEMIAKDSAELKQLADALYDEFKFFKV